MEYTGFLVGEQRIRPNNKMIKAIQEFKKPRTVTDIRAWFGLVNQVSPFFASRPVIQPFRELLKAPAKGKRVYWDTNLAKLFEESKQVIIDSIAEGIKSFSQDRITCLATDWSKDGIGYLLMQKKCSCPEIVPTCCSGGWGVVLAGSRFCTGAESRYSPVEGEAQGVVWALEKTRHYTLGNPRLIVATDHKPLLKLFGDKRFGDIANPRLARLKEGTLRWEFSMVHIPGKLNFGPDALSRQAMTAGLVGVLHRERPSEEDQETVEELEAVLVAETMARLPSLVSWEDVRAHMEKDQQLSELADQVRQGFPPDRKLVTQGLREFWRCRDELSLVENVVLYKGRVVVPKSLRNMVLETLHSAHQGVYGMLLRADKSVWWPGMAADVRQVRAQCSTCDEVAPSQPQGMPVEPESPVHPFQSIFADHFSLRGRNYLVIVDRFSGWPSVSFCGASTGSSRKVTEVLREFLGGMGCLRYYQRMVHQTL